MPISKTAAALAATLSLASMAPAHAIDDFFPEFGNEGIDVLHYDLALDVKVSPHILTGRATLDIVALEQLSSFTLDLAGFDVLRVRINGAPAAFTRIGDKLEITPASPIQPQRRFKVAIVYRGEPTPIQDPTAPGDPDYLLGWFKYQNGTYALSEPVGASTFYPANDEPDDKATFRIAVTAERPLIGVANGAPQSIKAVSNNRREFVWEMDEPMTTWLATVHVNRYAVRQDVSATGIPLRLYTTNATSRDDIAGYEAVKEMLEWMTAYVGPYPFDSYGQIVVDDPALYYALETQAMSTFPVGAAYQSIVTHELAHQWFGNSVSVKEWRDLWLAEGFATYFEVLYPHRYNTRGFEAEMQGLYNFAVRTSLGSAVVERGDQIFSNRTYVRGALTLFALRQTVGESVFKRIVRAWASQNVNGSVTSADFIDTAEAISGNPDVRPLLDAWIFQQPVPPLPGTTAMAAADAATTTPDIVGLACGGNNKRAHVVKCDVAASE